MPAPFVPPFTYALWRILHPRPALSPSLTERARARALSVLNGRGGVEGGTVASRAYAVERFAATCRNLAILLFET